MASGLGSRDPVLCVSARGPQGDRQGASFCRREDIRVVPKGRPVASQLTLFYRVRVGDYRIVYQVRDDVIVVVIVHVGHRREVYRGL